MIGMVRIRAVGNQQLDALKAAGADRGAERDVTVRIRRVDDAGVSSGNLGDPVLISRFDCHDKLLAQRPSTHTMRSRYFILRLLDALHHTNGDPGGLPRRSGPALLLLRRTHQTEIGVAIIIMVTND